MLRTTQAFLKAQAMGHVILQGVPEIKKPPSNLLWHREKLFYIAKKIVSSGQFSHFETDYVKLPVPFLVVLLILGGMRNSTEMLLVNEFPHKMISKFTFYYKH